MNKQPVASGVRRSGQLAVSAGVLWLILWLHQAMTHGLSAENEERLFLGATWMDSGKFYVLPFLILLGFVVLLYRTNERRSRLGVIGFALTVLSLGAVAVGVAIQFWAFPFGSYELSFEEAAIARAGGLVQSLATLVLVIALILFGVDLSRNRTIPWWMIPVLVVTALGGFYLTPATFVPGLGWMAVGVGLWVSKRDFMKGMD